MNLSWTDIALIFAIVVIVGAFFYLLQQHNTNYVSGNKVEGLNNVSSNGSSGNSNTQNSANLPSNLPSNLQLQLPNSSNFPPNFVYNPSSNNTSQFASQPSINPNLPQINTDFIQPTSNLGETGTLFQDR
jgi:hypothetical protein